MASPLSDEERFNSWVAAQQSPPPKKVCECICHSRKLTPELLERMDRQFVQMEKMVQEMTKATRELQIAIKDVQKLKK